MDVSAASARCAVPSGASRVRWVCVSLKADRLVALWLSLDLSRRGDMADIESSGARIEGRGRAPAVGGGHCLVCRPEGCYPVCGGVGVFIRWREKTGVQLPRCRVGGSPTMLRWRAFRPLEWALLDPKLVPRVGVPSCDRLGPCVGRRGDTKYPAGLDHGTDWEAGLAPSTGVEPVTYRLGGGCSILLSYEGVGRSL